MNELIDHLSMVPDLVHSTSRTPRASKDPGSETVHGLNSGNKYLILIMSNQLNQVSKLDPSIIHIFGKT